MKIDGRTKIVGLLGKDIDYTLSPVMHNAAFQALNLNYIYLPFPIKPYSLKEALIGLKALNIVGVNVTIPYKEEVMEYLDEVSLEAREIGAVNTIKIDHKLIGYNTDGSGFITSLDERGVEVSGKHVFLIGCGGAGRAVSFALAKRGVRKITLLDRVVDKAERLAEEISRITPCSTIRIEEIEDCLFDTDILINATPVGMEERDPLLIDPNWLHPHLFVYDLIYTLPETPLLKHAFKRGAKGLSGRDMLVYQGALSFEIWTGVKPPIDLMKEAIREEIEGRG